MKQIIKAENNGDEMRQAELQHRMKRSFLVAMVVIRRYPFGEGILHILNSVLNEGF